MIRSYREAKETKEINIISILRPRLAIITSTAMFSRLRQENDGAKSHYPVFIHILNQSSVAMRLLKTVTSLEPLLK